jgi:hypothetical protein
MDQKKRHSVRSLLAAIMRLGMLKFQFAICEIFCKK